MARKKKRTLKLRPKAPARVRKKKRAARSHGRHPELWGLGLVALGAFLGVVLYGGWNGGLAGATLAPRAPPPARAPPPCGPPPGLGGARPLAVSRRPPGVP